VLRTDVSYSEGPRCTLNLGKTYRRRAYIHSPLAPSRNIACRDNTTGARPGLSGESCTSDGGFPSRISWNRTCLATETQAGSNLLTAFPFRHLCLPKISTRLKSHKINNIPVDLPRWGGPRTGHVISFTFGRTQPLEESVEFSVGTNGECQISLCPYKDLSYAKTDLFSFGHLIRLTQGRESGRGCAARDAARA
jgi:hypothetical protein